MVMACKPETTDTTELLSYVNELEQRLRESEETLDAIRHGEIDALVVSGCSNEQRIYTLETADRPYRIIIEQIQEGTITLSDDGVILYCNRRMADMLEVRQERVIGRTLQSFVSAEDASGFSRLLEDAKIGVARRELILNLEGGGKIIAYLSLSSLQRDDGEPLLCGVLTDLTEQKLHLTELAAANSRLTEEIAERERIEEALRQSQKMEAVGQLTGGLAHDFNNLLAGISGSLELLQTRIAQGRIRDADRYVNAAQGAAKRAAALTHRLLAFSRRQTLDPKSTDVNRLVTDMEELIRRTVGPQVVVEVVKAIGLWNTLVDANQLENALLNLCINARDAMPEHGRLTIETANTWLDRNAGRERELSPGQYVSLSVTDTGTGMPPDVIRRAFDPFFTTKPIGEGTGLGLSMIYGFVRQSGGQVRIYSELGQGTLVCLYLPRHLGAEELATPSTELAVAPRAERGETVLIVDDEPTVRMLVTEVLEDLGYTALEAADGAAALKLLQSDIHIDLLVTDVGLPGGLNGRQVADAGRATRPKLKVLFITGYAENAVVGNGQLERGMEILTKPFPLESLATRIKDLIQGN